MIYVINFFGNIWRELFPEKIYRLYVGPALVYRSKKRLMALKQYDSHVQRVRLWNKQYGGNVTLVLRTRRYHTTVEILKRININPERENDTITYNIPLTSRNKANGRRRFY